MDISPHDDPTAVDKHWVLKHEFISRMFQWITTVVAFPSMV